VKEFHISCVEASAKYINAMVDNSREISYQTLLRHVGFKHLMEIFPSYEQNGAGFGLRFKDDYAVSYYKSKYRGKPCVYVKHSAIEYVFI
jgi:hypothetical protein